MSRSTARASSRLKCSDSYCASTIIPQIKDYRRWILLSSALISIGCQAVQNRMIARSEHCSELCAQARAARENGDAAGANRFINEALRQRPSDVEMRRELAETMWSSGRQTEAIVQYLTMCEERPADVKLFERLAVMQWETHQPLAAANTAISVLRLDPHSKDGLLIKARNDVHQGKLDDALVSYIKLSQTHASDIVILKELGELHLKRGQPDRACPLFRTAVQQSPVNSSERSEIEWLLGVAYARSDRWSMAVNILEQSIVSRSATADDWCLLGSAHLQIGDMEAARADLEEARKCDSSAESTQKLSERLQATVAFSKEESDIVPVSYQSK